MVTVWLGFRQRGIPSRDNLSGAEDWGLSFGSFREVLKGGFDGRTVVEKDGICDGMLSKLVVDASDDTAGEKGRGSFWIVPRTGELDLLMVTLVPRGNGWLIGSVQYRRGPQVRPPLKRMDLGSW